MTIKNLVILVFIGFLLFTCNQGKDDTNSEKILQYNVCDWEVESVIPIKIIKEIRFLALETNKDNLIGNIDKIVAFKENIYILDTKYRKDILVFDRQGKYIKKIGNFGRGFGEFIRLTDFNIDGEKNNLVVLDSQMHKLLFYDLTSGFCVQEFKLDFWAHNFIIQDEKTFIFYSKAQRSKENYLIAKLNLNNKNCKWFIEQDEYDTRISPRFSMFQSENNYFTSYFKDIVYRITDNGIEPFVKFDFGQQKIPSDRLKKIEKHNVDEYLKLMNEKDWTYNIENFLESGDFLTFNFILKGSLTFAVYSKKSKEFNHGIHFEAPFERLKPLKFIAINQNEFITVMDAVSILKMKESVQNRKKLLDFNFPSDKQLSQGSNPVLIFLKFNSF